MTCNVCLFLMHMYTDVIYRLIYSNVSEITIKFYFVFLNIKWSTFSVLVTDFALCHQLHLKVC